MSSPSMPTRAVRVLLALLCCTPFLGAVPGGPLALAADEPAAQPTVQWYEEKRDGNKTGYRRVVWAPSTWEGRPTVRDTTTVVTATQRDMAGMKDTFSTTVTVELERSADGTLWWQHTRVEEGQRVMLEELKWTGAGYSFVSRIEGQDGEQRVEVKLDEPVQVDAESVLGARIRAGTLEAGTKLTLRQLDLRGRRAHAVDLEVAGKETVRDGAGAEIESFKIVQRDPKAGTELLLWLDTKGTFVKLRIGAFSSQRTTQEKAEEMPVQPAEFSITVPAYPRLERIFSADRVRVDVHVRADEHRKFPDFPDSPWSRVEQVDGPEGDSRIARMLLTRHDEPKAKARIPVLDASFARQLEATSLMQTNDPTIKAAAASVVGDEHDARTAAHKLARFVFTKLRKQSPDVGQADAVQILRDCRGDCSEHALLYVTLCRAAGIPARRCSGFVCIGGIWGAHAWCEIWTGAWIGADPTTGEVGTAARYIFYGYPDEPDSFPGVVSSRATGRLRIVTTRVEEGAASYDLSDPANHRIYDPANHRYNHVLAGLEARDVPEDWRVELSADRRMMIRGSGFMAGLQAGADQGADIDSIVSHFPGTRTTFAGAPALLRKVRTTRIYLIFSRRRMVHLSVSGADDGELEQLEKVLAATFTEPPLAWDPVAPAAPAPKEDEGGDK
jgi:transglutaminase-like putative cysteine protease